MKITIRIFLISSLAAFFLVGCSDDKKDSNNATLSFIAEQNLAKSAAPGDLTIDTAKILITRIKFGSQGDSDSMDFEEGPLVVNLDLSGNVQTVSAAHIPQGTYDHIKFEIHKAGQNEDLPDPDFRTGTGGNERYSIIIIGTYNLNRFVFKSRNTINQSVNIDPPLVIADSIGVANLTLAVDVSNWFNNGLGGKLDPTNVNANNVAAIENTIKDSFRGFKDNDKDGNETN